MDADDSWAKAVVFRTNMVPSSKACVRKSKGMISTILRCLEIHYSIPRNSTLKLWMTLDYWLIIPMNGINYLSQISIGWVKPCAEDHWMRDMTSVFKLSYHLGWSFLHSLMEKVTDSPKQFPVFSLRDAMAMWYHSGPRPHKELICWRHLHRP